MADQATSPVAARHASTVLLLRDSDRGVEVFMERRHIQSDFVGGAYVFPGGRVDPEDRVDEALCHGLTDREASGRLALEEGGLTFYVAAIRECFEEAGVLLAYDRDGRILDFSDRAVEEHFERLRGELNAGRQSLLDIAAAESLTLATDRISYWAHWITPEGQPRRYDTRFFVTRAPGNQTAGHDDHELTSSAWVTAEEALEHGRRKEWMIIFPTIRNLQKLSRFESADAAIAAVD
ncbi:MAG: NUDIX domain-containing protein, partial [Acidobacteriota bacterium]|nr:NUDIX domain-containing protein [Acidobacteriota bacterium]